MNDKTKFVVSFSNPVYYVIALLLIFIVILMGYAYYSRQFVKKLKTDYKILENEYNETKETLNKSNKKIIYLRKKIGKYEKKIDDIKKSLEEKEKKYNDLKNAYAKLKKKPITDEEKKVLLDYFSLEFYTGNNQYCFEPNKIMFVLRECKYSKEALNLCDKTLKEYTEQNKLLLSQNLDLKTLNEKLTVNNEDLKLQVENLEKMLKLQKKIGSQEKIKISIYALIAIALLTGIVIAK